MDNTVSEMTRQYWIDTLLGWAERRLAPPQFDECKRALDLDHYALARRSDLQGANMQLLVALKAKQAADARVAALEAALWRCVELPNELRYQMGTTIGSTRRDEAYAEGWNDLRTALGREISELVDRTLNAELTP
jgi:hypothetical protein